MNYPCIKIPLYDKRINILPNFIPYMQCYYIRYMQDENIYAVSFKTSKMAYLLICVHSFFIPESPTCANTNCQGNFWSRFCIEKEGCRG